MFICSPKFIIFICEREKKSCLIITRSLQIAFIYSSGRLEMGLAMRTHCLIIFTLLFCYLACFDYAFPPHFPVSKDPQLDPPLTFLYRGECLLIMTFMLIGENRHLCSLKLLGVMGLFPWPVFILSVYFCLHIWIHSFLNPIVSWVSIVHEGQF